MPDNYSQFFQEEPFTYNELIQNQLRRPWGCPPCPPQRQCPPQRPCPPCRCPWGDGRDGRWDNRWDDRQERR